MDLQYSFRDLRKMNEKNQREALLELFYHNFLEKYFKSDQLVKGNL